MCCSSNKHRPLRALSRLKSLRAVVVCFTTALPYMISVFTLILLLMIIFAIVGLQLFMGIYHYKCVDPVTKLVENYEAYGQGSLVYDEYGCGSGLGRDCPAEYGLCAKFRKPQLDIAPGFDNLGQSMLSIFQVVTLEWSYIFYRAGRFALSSISRVVSTITYLTPVSLQIYPSIDITADHLGYAVILFFIPVILFIAYLMMSILLAVVRV